MSDLMEKLPLTSLVTEGRYGPKDGPAGVTAKLLATEAATLVARRAGNPQAALADKLGLPATEGPKAAFGGGLTAIGTGPGRWLVVADAGTDLAGRLEAAVADQGAVTDQSDAYMVFELSGPKVRDALAKGAMVDLDPVAFGPGDATTTSMAFVGVTLWQSDAAPTYRIAVGRSFAASFLRIFTAGAAEYGFVLEGTGRG
ncbi:sarcosine oxidase subunit gamma [Xanthobacteraceae bacterium A53D]